jgi:hypothetical protein
MMKTELSIKQRQQLFTYVNDKANRQWPLLASVAPTPANSPKVKPKM